MEYYLCGKNECQVIDYSRNITCVTYWCVAAEANAKLLSAHKTAYVTMIKISIGVLVSIHSVCIFIEILMFCCYISVTDPKIHSLRVFKCTSSQSSVVVCLLKGTSKGIQSLLEESLVATREMLREAQLTYPRSPVRDLNSPWSLLFLAIHWCSDFPFSVRRCCRA